MVSALGTFAATCPNEMYERTVASVIVVVEVEVVPIVPEPGTEVVVGTVVVSVTPVGPTGVCVSQAASVSATAASTCMRRGPRQVFAEIIMRVTPLIRSYLVDDESRTRNDNSRAARWSRRNCQRDGR